MSTFVKLTDASYGEAQEIIVNADHITALRVGTYTKREEATTRKSLFGAVRVDGPNHTGTKILLACGTWVGVRETQDEIMAIIADAYS